jgi:type IV secretory pathway TraG/TraD family ATPase VirD4
MEAQQRGGGIYLGRVGNTWTYTGHGRSALVLGPTRSGKTTSLIIPNLLGHPGPVVSTSTKTELVDVTSMSRAELGDVQVFDPTGIAEIPRNVQRIGWNPVTGCDDWDRAMLTAAAMVEATSGGRELDHWTERAGALLSPLLHAAGLDEVPLRRVVEWIDRRDPREAMQILEASSAASVRASALLDGICMTEEREQSSIWSSTSGALRAYRSEAALSSAEGIQLDPDAFMSECNTLYLCGASRQQSLLAPLFVGVLTQLRDTAYDHHALGLDSPPALFALDEVANIAPFPDLPNLVSEGGGQGIVTLACLQDLSQARRRWGDQARGFLSLFPVTVLLPGIADGETLKLVRDLSGEVLQPLHSASRTGPWWKHSTGVSVSETWRPRWSIDQVAQGSTDQALVLTPSNQLREVALTPSHRDQPWLSLRGNRARFSSRSR